MNDRLNLLASLALISLVLFAAGCISQPDEHSSTTTTNIEVISDSDIIQDVEQSWSSDNDSVEIGEMI